MANLLASKIKNVILFATTAIAFGMTSLSVNADGNETYLLVRKANGEMGISFSVPYTAGVHTGKATAGEGSIELSSEGKILQGKFTVPLTAMTTDNPKRDCHLIEAMGLDYTVARYPKEHICSASNKLPESGSDSVAYPTIEFQITKFDETNTIDGVTKGTVTGVWSMHGVSQDFRAPIEATQTATGATVKSKFTLSLAAYGIFVKPVLVVSVKDTVTVTLDLDLQKKQ